MAYPNVGLSRLGLAEGNADNTELFLKVFSGEVLTSFERASKIRPLVRSRTITSGKSAQFPAIGKASALYHVAGENLLDDNGTSYLNSINHGEQVILIDRSLVAPVMIHDLDEAMNHYDVRGPYSKELGEALATKADEQLTQLLGIGARTAAASLAVSDHPTGSVLWHADMATVATTLVKGIRVASGLMDDKDIPESDRYCVLRPFQYNLLIEGGEFIDTQFNVGANGGRDSGTVHRAFGMTLVKSNNIPSTNIATTLGATGTKNEYGGEQFTDTVGFCFHKGAVGTLMLKGLMTEMEYKIEYQADLMLAKIAVGHGLLYPGAVVELNKQADADTPVGNDDSLALY
jgi:hypothetical protein